MNQTFIRSMPALYRARLMFTLPTPTQNQILLSKISQALKLAIHRFQTESKIEIINSQTKVKSYPKQHSIEIPIISLLESDQENSIGVKKPLIPTVVSRVKIQQNDICIHKKGILSIHSTEVNKFSSSEQLLSSNSNINNKILPVKKIRKNKPAKTTKHQRVVKRMDFCQNVHIKYRPFGDTQLVDKKIALIMRQVQNWQYAQTGRKERRQVRMLKF